jgi:ribosomal protein S12 methylthiotransferase accessory factor
MPEPILFRGHELRAQKRFVAGTHRCAAPEETLDRIRPHFTKAGITRLADVTGLDRVGLDTTIAYRPNAESMVTQAGKGYTRTAAMVSAAMEAIEVHHAENVRLAIRREAHADLAAESPVVPADKLLVTRNACFDARRPESWVTGFDLVGQVETYVPFALVAMAGQRNRPHAVPHSFAMGSNGLASGNHLLEAMSAGLLEVIERDAIACHTAAWRTGRTQMRRVDLAGIAHPLVVELLERLRRARVAPIVYDCTVDTAVPVYCAYIYDETNRHVGMYHGYGAHLDPAIALIRAVTEAAQARVVYIAGARDDYFRQDRVLHFMSDNRASLARLQHAGLPDEVSLRESAATTCFEGDLSLLMDRLRKAGCDQIIIVDLTQEAFDVPVVRVIVPGLEGYMFQHYVAGTRARAFAELS